MIKLSNQHNSISSVIYSNKTFVKIFTQKSIDSINTEMIYESVNTKCVNDEPLTAFGSIIQYVPRSMVMSEWSWPIFQN